MFPVAIIASKAREAGLSYLVIGGHAVNVYAEPRATIDVDFLVRRSDQAAWEHLLRAEGFQPFNHGDAFEQFSPPYGVNWRLDLMLVNDATFASLLADSREQNLLGIVARIPSPEHLLSLKLHAIKYGGEDRFEKDFGDVVGITRHQKLAVTSPEFREMFLKHASAELYERLLRRIQ